MQSPNGYELHIPRDLDAEETPVTFSSAIHEDENAPRGAVPFLSYSYDNDADAGPVVIPDGDEIHFRGAKCKLTFADPNRPALHAHVEVYKDYVLLGFTFAHLVADAEGIAILFRAWAAATRNELDSVVACPRDFCPLLSSQLLAAAEAAGQHVDPWPLETNRGYRLLGLFSTIIVIVQFVWSMVTRGPKEGVFIRVPKRWVADQKALANKEVESINAKDRLAVSSNDILQALVAKVRGYVVSV